ncbi:MAG: AAA family ATPase [Anaerolineaceae bacterium]|nr:AAA family ATPase [Anaerolineaceae bacterium]
MANLKLFFLGPPRIELDGDVLEIESRKAVAVLAYLAITARSHSRDALSTLFWPEADQSQARSYLRHTLWLLKKVLGDGWLDISREQVESQPRADIWLDVIAFQQRAETPLPQNSSAKVNTEALPLLAGAVELYRGDFLAGFTLPDTPDFDEWQFFQTEALREKLANALERLVWGYSRQSDYEAAIPYGRRWVALDPLHEQAQRHLMQLYSEAGQKAAALRQYEEYAALLEKELGLSPQVETTTLYEAIKAKRIVEPFLKANKPETPSTSVGIDHQAGGQEVAFLPTASSQLDRQAALQQVDQLRDSGNYVAAIDLLNRLLARHPIDESTHRELMHLYALAGRRHESLRQYQTCLEALAANGAFPDPTTEALYRQIMSGQVTPPPAPTPNPVGLPPTPIAIEMEQSTPLAGRREELTFLQKRIQAARQGQGCTLLLAGEAGVGKTRLAYEALRFAAETRTSTLIGAAYEEEGHLPYQPFIEAFDRYLAEQHRPPEQHPITHYQPLGSSDLQLEYSALFKATVTFLVTLAGDAPVVLVLDDLHAADEASLSLFHYLARQTRSIPVVLLATYRTDIVASPASPFGRLLSALYREQISEVYHLNRLSEQDDTQIITYVLGGAAEPTLLKSITELAEGNPFCTQEITRAMLKADHLVQEAGQWRMRSGITLSVSAELQALLRGRMHRLGRTIEPALTAAAIIGREFQFPVLRAVVDLPDGELLDALDVALRGHLLDETETGYRFRHSLIRHTLYNSLSQARRAWLHTRVAQAIETTSGAHPDRLRLQAESLAFHYILSDQRGQALPYLIQSGHKALDIYALEMAVGYFEQALNLMDELALADPGQRWHILLQLASCSHILANARKGVAYAEQALALEPTENWQPASHEKIYLYLEAAFLLITSGDMNPAQSFLELAQLEVGEIDENRVEYADLLYYVALWHWHRDAYQQAYDMAQQCLKVAEKLDAPDALARAYEVLALAAHSLGKWQEGLNFEEQRSTLVGANMNFTIAFDAHLCLWEYHLYGDRAYEEVKHTVDQTLQQAERMGALRAIAVCKSVNGVLDYQVGRWLEAEASLRASIQLCRQLGTASCEAIASQRLGDLLTVRGELEEGRSILESGVMAAERAHLRAHCQTRIYAALARNRLAANDLTAASQSLALGLAASEAHGQCGTCESLLLPVAVSVRVAQGDLTGAKTFADHLDEAAARYSSRTWLALATQARGKLAAAQGEIELAESYFKEALAGFQAADNEVEAAQCQAALDRLPQV